MKPVLLSLLLAFALSACERQKPAALPARVEKTEESWILTTVCEELARLAAFAKTSGAADPLSPTVIVARVNTPDGVPPLYQATISGIKNTPDVSATLAITETPWSPGLYADLARKLTARCRIKPLEKKSRGTLDALTQFSAETLRDENRLLSDALSEHPNVSAIHDSAAVLLGAFALRENSGWLWDPKLACSRATAHLAFAAALRKDRPASDEAAVAELLIGLIMDAKADCAARIEALKKRVEKNPALAPWVAAAALRNSRDWRLPPHGAAGTQLEKIEKFRALCDGASTDLAVNYLRTAGGSDATDWNRIALSVGYGVGTGHLFTQDYVARELAEASMLLDRPYPNNKTEMDSFIQALNHSVPAPPHTNSEGKGRLEVIDSALWRRAAQRHICHAIYQTWNFMENKWGVHDQAGDFWHAIESVFAPLDLFPLIAFRKADNAAEARPWAARLQQLFADHPEDVPDILWSRACSERFNSLFPAVQNLAITWFDPPLPSGTAFRFGGRAGFLPNFRSPGEKIMEALYRIAPLQEAVAVRYYEVIHPGEKNARAFKKILGPLADYECDLMGQLADMADSEPILQEETLRRIAQIDPNNYEKLARFYLGRNDHEKARDAYQASFDKATDRVMVSNTSRWLVDYYYDTGEPIKAFEIARACAQVYSYRGLDTFAAVLERMNDLTKAEEAYASIAGRYDDPAPLLRFYDRQLEKVPISKYAEKKEALERQNFPGGIQHVSLPELTEKPQRGVVITQNSPRLEQNGLKPGDVIVAVDEKRVESFRQYSIIRDLKDVPEMALIIFRDGKYKEIFTRSEDRRFGCDMRDWQAGSG